MKRAATRAGWFACALILVQPMLACAMSCTLIASGRFDFGAYDPLSPVPLDVQATYMLQCLPDHPHEKLNLKITAQTDAASNSLHGTVAGKAVRFGMYVDPGRHIPIDGRAIVELSDRLSTPKEYPVTIYGRMPARQNIPAGSYRAGITFLIEY